MRSLPRPYSQQESETIWRILNARGDALSRLGVAIGEETGLRISETASQEFHGALGAVPREDEEVLAEWLTVRDKSCSHDLLFYNSLGKPLTSNTLWRHLRRIFDGYQTKRRPTCGEVLDGFKYHCLRHSPASS